MDDKIAYNAVKAVKALQKGTNAKAVGYSVYPNAMPSSQEAAPYLGRTLTGTCEEDELENVMIKEGCEVGKAGIRLVMNATYAYMMERMPKAPKTYDIGFMRFYPVMDGTLPKIDADFDPERNSLYVAAAPSDSIRYALSGGTPTRSGGSSGVPGIFNVLGTGLSKPFTIRSGEPFDILAVGVTAGLPGEHAEMELPDKTKVPVSLEVTEKHARQRIVGRLAQTVQACTDAKLVLWTHGPRADGAPILVNKGGITILAGETPPEPTPTGPVVTSINGNDTLHPGSSNLIYGRQMAFSTPYWGNHVRILDASGSDMQAMVSTDPDTATSSQLFALNIAEGLPLRDGVSYVVEFEMQDAAGQLVIVTHSARWQASA